MVYYRVFYNLLGLDALSSSGPAGVTLLAFFARPFLLPSPSGFFGSVGPVRKQSPPRPKRSWRL